MSVGHDETSLVDSLIANLKKVEMFWRKRLRQLNRKLNVLISPKKISETERGELLPGQR